MNNPIDRVPSVFGQLVSKLRTQQGLEPSTFASAASLTGTEELLAMERGSVEPTLSGFFRIADALSQPAPILFIDLMTAWREEPIPELPDRSGPSNFSRLYRVAYFASPNDFRELPRAYESIDEATGTARVLNVLGATRREQPLLDHITIYVRLGCVGIQLNNDESGNAEPTEERTPAKTLDTRIHTSIAEVHTTIAAHQRRSDRDSPAAIESLRSELQRLRSEFERYELDIDRVSHLLTAEELKTLRSTIRGFSGLMYGLVHEFPPGPPGKKP